MPASDTFTELLREELTPRPDPAFAEEMDAWVEDGFPPRERRRRPPRRAGAWLDRAVRVTRSPLGMAGAGTAVAALVVALVLVGDSAERAGDGQSPSTVESARPAPTTPAEPDRSAGDGLRRSSGSALPVPAPPGGIAPGEDDRRIERSAQLTLAAPADDFQATADRIVALTDRHDGFVLRSNVATGDDPSGDFQLRIPADRLGDALRDLAALGDVRSRSDTGQDVTREYVSATDSYADARAERRALLRRLRAADGEAEIQRLRDRLDLNARERARLRAQVRELRERTNYAAVSVSLIEREGADGGAGAGGTGDALDDALGLLVGSFNWLLRALGVLIPVAVVGGAAWWAARTLRRRRREAVLF
jgi:hypothetical protein